MIKCEIKYMEFRLIFRLGVLMPEEELAACVPRHVLNATNESYDVATTQMFELTTE